jgi:hypothetical protein
LRTVVAALLWCGLAFAQSKWTTVLVQPGRFSVELPAAHRYELKGAVHQYVVEINQRAFVVQGGTYPWNIDVSDPRARLQADLINAARELNGGAWSEVKWSELPAADAVGRKEGVVIRSYSTLIGADYVTLTYAGPPGSERAPEVERFIGSLKRVR